MKISIIVAMDEAGGIGKNNQLPWKYSEDLKYFRKLTQGSNVIKGRKTLDSIGKALPNRKNIVISSSLSNVDCADTWIVRSVNEALEMAKKIGSDIFAIVGAKIHEQTVSFVNFLYLTQILGKHDGDSLSLIFKRVEHYNVLFSE